MHADSILKLDPDSRMKEYIGKVAVGPRMSKNLTREEAEDALSLILNGLVSQVRAGIFLIAARMKRETLDENLGYWSALDKTTVRQKVKVKELLQVADPFDGFNRTPYFGFYSIPVIAAMGLPCYGHSALPLPPKFGITCQDILQNHYQVSSQLTLENAARKVEEFGFTFVGLHQSHPQLERLRNLRTEMIKRTALATFEKMLSPLSAESRSNYLATSYFHPGYETPMIAAAEESRFQKTIIGDGLEGTTLFGVNKAAATYVLSGKGPVKEWPVNIKENLSPDIGSQIYETYRELKNEESTMPKVTGLGEQALKNASGPAAPLIAWQAACLCRLCEFCDSFQTGYEAAWNILKDGTAYESFLKFIESCKQI